MAEQGQTATISPLHGLDPSLPDDRRRLARNRRWRRFGVGVLALVVLAGATGMLGVRSRTVEAEENGYHLEVRYAHVARAALAVPWEVTVHHAGGFDGPITVATTAGYFRLFDENGFFPEPAASTADDDGLRLEFDAPPGDTFSVFYDGRVGPNIQLGRRATTRILVDGEVVASVTYRTWILP